MKKIVRKQRVNARVLAGITLIAVSVAGVFFVVRLSTRTTPTVVAAHLLVEGQQIREGDVTMKNVQIDEIAQAYIAEPGLVIGKVVMRSVAAGELVPRASLGEASEVIETSVVVDLGSPLASRVTAGSLVDLWAASDAKTSAGLVNENREAPHLVVSRARVAAVVPASGTFGGAAERVELVLDRSQVPAVLDAQSQGLVLNVVAASGGLFS